MFNIPTLHYAREKYLITKYLSLTNYVEKLLRFIPRQHLQAYYFCFAS